MSKRTFLIRASAVILLSWMVLHGQEVVSIASVYAQPAVAAANPLQSVVYMLSGVIFFITTVLTFIGWVFFRILDVVMRPEFILDLGKTNGLEAMLNSIWVLSRDIVNVLFVFILIGGAIMTIVEGSTEKLRVLIPKFVAALILVNFSWFAPRVILDIANVLTASINQIPNAMGGDTTCKMPDPTNPNNMINCKVVCNFQFLSETTGKTSNGNTTCFPDLVCFDTIDYTNATTGCADGSTFTLLQGLVTNFSMLPNLIKPNIAGLQNGQPGGAVPANATVSKYVAFLVQYILVIIIYIAIVFMLAAMLLAFLVRIPILWLTMAFMPFVALNYVAGDKLKAAGVDQVQKVWTNFLASAFLPAMVALPMAIGFIMIRAGMKTPSPQILQQLGGKFPLFAGIRDLWQLLWLFMALAIMWSGVFAALKKQEISASFTEKINSFGKQLGGHVASAPLWGIRFPMPSGQKGQPPKNMSIMQMFQGMQNKMYGATHQPVQSSGANQAATMIQNSNDAKTNVQNIKVSISNSTATQQSIDQQVQQAFGHIGGVNNNAGVKLADVEKAIYDGLTQAEQQAWKKAKP